MLCDAQLRRDIECKKDASMHLGVDNLSFGPSYFLHIYVHNQIYLLPVHLLK